MVTIEIKIGIGLTRIEMNWNRISYFKNNFEENLKRFYSIKILEIL